MTIEQAKSIQLTDYLHSIGCTPCKQQNNNLWYHSPLRAESEPSFKVNLNHNEWYDFGIGKGGDLVALVRAQHSADVAGALQILSGKPIIPGSFSFRQQESFQSFEDISVKPLANVALLQFLRERGITDEIAKAHCKEVYYKLGGKPYFAVAFENDREGYEIRNKYFKGCISPKAITWQCDFNRACCVFEGFMDFLSFLTICKREGTDVGKYDALVLNSAGNILHALQPLRNYEQIHGYLDNDTAGQRATAELRSHFGEKFTDHSPKYSQYKDLNDYLTGQRQEQKQQPKPNRGFRL